MSEPMLLCCHGVSLARTCLLCPVDGVEDDGVFAALVLAGTYDAEGYTPAERRQAAKKAKRVNI